MCPWFRAVSLLDRGPGRHQQQAPQSPRLEDPRRSPQRAATVAPPSRCCIDWLNPVSFDLGKFTERSPVTDSLVRWVKSAQPETTRPWNRFCASAKERSRPAAMDHSWRRTHRDHHLDRTHLPPPSTPTHPRTIDPHRLRGHHDPHPQGGLTQPTCHRNLRQPPSTKPVRLAVRSYRGCVSFVPFSYRASVGPARLLRSTRSTRCSSGRFDGEPARHRQGDRDTEDRF